MAGEWSGIYKSKADAVRAFNQWLRVNTEGGGIPGPFRSAQQVSEFGSAWENHELYDTWVNAGMTTAQLGAPGQGIAPELGAAIDVERIRGEAEGLTPGEIHRRTIESFAPSQAAPPPPGGEPPGDGAVGFGLPQFPAEAPPPGFEWDFDPSTNRYIPIRTGISAVDQASLDFQKEESLARLAAQPISWLQYSALSGQPPVVQPWMEVLQRPGQNLVAGQPIPGIQNRGPVPLPLGMTQVGGGQIGGRLQFEEGLSFENLPNLMRPSAQGFAGMGPIAQQQFLGFQQARTGIPPEEALFRQRQGGPPGGGAGFQQQRFRR